LLIGTLRLTREIADGVRCAASPSKRPRLQSQVLRLAVAFWGWQTFGNPKGKRPMALRAELLARVRTKQAAVNTRESTPAKPLREKKLGHRMPAALLRPKTSARLESDRANNP